MLLFAGGFIAGVVIASLPQVRGVIYAGWAKLQEARKRNGWV
jgi:hypothetical protein